METRYGTLLLTVTLLLECGGASFAQTKAIYSVAQAEVISRQTGRPVLAIAGTKG